MANGFGIQAPDILGTLGRALELKMQRERFAQQDAIQQQQLRLQERAQQFSEQQAVTGHAQERRRLDIAERQALATHSLAESRFGLQARQVEQNLLLAQAQEERAQAAEALKREKFEREQDTIKFNQSLQVGSALLSMKEAPLELKTQVLQSVQELTDGLFDNVDMTLLNDKEADSLLKQISDTWGLVEKDKLTLENAAVIFSGLASTHARSQEAKLAAGSVMGLLQEERLRESAGLQPHILQLQTGVDPDTLEPIKRPFSAIPDTTQKSGFRLEPLFEEPKKEIKMPAEGGRIGDLTMAPARAGASDTPKWLEKRTPEEMAFYRRLQRANPGKKITETSFDSALRRAGIKKLGENITPSQAVQQGKADALKTEDVGIFGIPKLTATGILETSRKRRK